MTNPYIPISWGELFDKITILEIKLEKLTDQNALENVEREYKQLRSILTESLQGNTQATELERDLKWINLQLWDIEDQIRDKERHKTFDDQFIELARSVYIINDKRAGIKSKINTLYDSEWMEEKSYTAY